MTTTMSKKLMSKKWNDQKMEWAVNGISKEWNKQKMTETENGMRKKWNVQKKEWGKQWNE